MTPDEFEDFVNMMYVLIHEESFVWEAPRGGTDVEPAGDVVHGPWYQSDCSAVLLAWHDAGPIGLYEQRPGERTADLDADAVKRLLSMEGAWTTDTAHVFLFPTERGQSEEYAEWRRAVPATMRDE